MLQNQETRGRPSPEPGRGMREAAELPERVGVLVGRAVLDLVAGHQDSPG